MVTTKGKFTRLILAASGRLPLWACRGLGWLLGIVFWLIPNRAGLVTRANIKLCFPEYNWWQRKLMELKSLQHTGMLTFEVAVIWHRPYHWLQTRIISQTGLALFEQARDRNQGVILLLPHLGNWEVFGSYIPQLAPMMALYEPPKLAELEAFIKSGREQAGAQLVPTNQRGVAALLRHLRAGGTTCILPDQVPNSNDRGGVFAPFFGHPAFTMTLVSQLVKKTGCQVLMATAQRVPGGFAIKFWPVDDNVHNDDDKISTTAINTSIEDCVRHFPAQYQWEYKRFRRTPQGGKKIY